MKTIWNMIGRPGNHSIQKDLPEVEDDEMLFSKNNVCVHPCVAGSAVPRHSLGYLTVTAEPDPALRHTLLLSWRPNQLMTKAAAGRGGPRSVSETQALATGDAASLYQPAAQHSDVTCGAGDVMPADHDVTTLDSDVTLCNGVAHDVGGANSDGRTAVQRGVRPRSAPQLKRPAAAAADQQQRGTCRRLSTQSAPPAPRPGAPPTDAPGMFTIDLGGVRSLRVFLTPADPGCGQLVVCSRQSQYRILHFHCGGLDRLVRLFHSWHHLLGGTASAEDGGCLLFSVCSPVVEEGEEHPEEGQHSRLTSDLWEELLTPDGRVEDPDYLRKLVFFGGLEPCLRPLVWPLLLGVLSFADSTGQRAEARRRLADEYDRTSALPEQLSEAERAEFQRLVVSTVDKDVVRTDPANPFFCGRSNPNVQTLQRILLGFAAANPSLGYTQGMSDLLAPLLVTLGSPADAYWALDALLKRSASVICPRDDVMDVQLGYLRELLRLLTPEFYSHLSAVEDGLELLFTHRWLLLCFKREFPEPVALQIWEACWSCPQTRHFCLFVCTAICAAYAADVTTLAMNADTMLLHFTSLSQHMDGQLVLAKARGLLHRFLSLDSVPCSLAPLCGGGVGGGGGGGGGPWDGRRVSPVLCGGHEDGRPCPAAAGR